MPLKGFVDEARKTNRVMEAQIEARRRMQNNDAGIIDISEGQAIPAQELEKLKQTSQNNKEGFNYIKKNNLEVESRETNDYSISRPGISAKTDFEKEYLQRSRNFNNTQREIQIGNGTGLGRTEQNNSKQRVETKHGNIIANVIRQSGNIKGQRVKWDECKFLKKDGENIYCKEYHCFCKKDSCPFSCR